MPVNITATFKKAERPRNGLEDIADKLISDELLHAEYIVVATVRPKRVVTDAEDGTKTPAVRFDHIEVVVDDADLRTVRDILTRRFKDRTGHDDDVPPASLFDVVDDGERVVPEPSADEILAERREAKAARNGAQAAEFSGGGDAA